jgi:hypothetical protein
MKLVSRAGRHFGWPDAANAVSMKLSCRQKVPCVSCRCCIEWGAIARLQSFRIKSFVTYPRASLCEGAEMFDRLSGTVAHETVNPLTR